ncbi:hypothetical protein PILCRDRAFT_303711 [Piloderma croceum F 1598]|uniref:Uncharacterized protein n=1 Tax=Piloderma croceum (strain F 1598) TaxID=765440 RepID=A0A0C3FSL7_PILCF|nr:hypothetical protein PILCRDRAFT_303711 [Piloderma croceum F 1598]
MTNKVTTLSTPAQRERHNCSPCKPMVPGLPVNQVGKMNVEENMQSHCLLYPNTRPVGKVRVYHCKTWRQTNREKKVTVYQQWVHRTTCGAQHLKLPISHKCSTRSICPALPEQAFTTASAKTSNEQPNRDKSETCLFLKLWDDILDGLALNF